MCIFQDKMATIKYTSKRERLTLRIKELMENYPSDWISLKEFVNFLIFDQYVSEDDVMSITQTATELGYFEIKDGKIISIKAKENKEKYEKEKQERLRKMQQEKDLQTQKDLNEVLKYSNGE